MFVAKLNPTGSGLVYATYLGGSGVEIEDNQSCSIAFDKDGNAYVAGSTVSTNFPTTVGAFQTTLSYDGNAYRPDGFITKLNPTGSALVYSTYLGGHETDSGNGIALMADGSVAVTGMPPGNRPVRSPSATSFRGPCGTHWSESSWEKPGIRRSWHFCGP